MSEIKIKASLDVNTGNSAKSVNDLNAEIKQTKQVLNEAKIGSKEYTEASKKLATQNEALAKSTGGAKGGLSQLREGLASTAPAMGGATQGAGMFNTALNTLRANPIVGVIVLVVAIIVKLWEKFSAMEKVSDSLGKAFSQFGSLLSSFLNAILTPLIDGFVAIVEWGTKAASFIVGIFSPAMKEEMDRAGELAETLDDLEDAERDSAIARAESNRSLQEAKELAEDANVPIKDRIIALQKAGRIEDEEITKQIEIATTRAKIVMEQLALEIGARDEVIQKIREGTAESLKAARAEMAAMKNIDKSKLDGIDKDIIAAEDLGAQKAKIAKKTGKAIEALQNEERKAAEDARKEAADKAKSASDAAAAKAKEYAAKQKAEADKQRAAEAAAKEASYQFEAAKKKQANDLELAQIEDGYLKAKRALEISLQNEIAAIQKQINDKKITKERGNILIAGLTALNFEAEKQLTNKHNAELKNKEAAFQDELSKIKLEIRLAGIKNEREKELVQLDLTFEEKLKQAQNRYKDDAIKLDAITAALDLQKQQQRKDLDAKYKLEDDAKQQDLSLKKIGWQLGQDGLELEQKRNLLLEKQRLIDEQYAKDIEAAGNNALQKQAIEQANLEVSTEISNARKALDRAEFQSKVQAAEGVASVLGSLANVIGKQTKVGKAFAIAEATISAIVSAQKAFQSTIGIPIVGGVLAPIAAGAALAAGYKNVKEIAKVNIPGGGGDASASTPNISTPTSPIAPTADVTSLDRNSIERVGNAAAGGVNRVFVLDADINDAAQRNTRINQMARLG